MRPSPRRTSDKLGDGMFNSVIIAHRNRVLSIRALLRTLWLSSQEVGNKAYEIIITDLGSNNASIREFETYKPLMNLKLFRMDYKGPFWKTKALNHCVSKASGKYITMIDADSLVQPSFLPSIENFYKKNDKKIKLAHRVRFLTQTATKAVASKARVLDAGIIEKTILNRYDAFSLARERYGDDEIILKDIPQSRRAFAMRKKALGNSHFTMLKDSYMAIGGYDERFIGHGLEDLDFNLRAWRYLKTGVLRPELRFTVFHISHHNTPGWYKEELRGKNRRIYRKNKKDGVIVIPKGKNWGKF